MRTTRSGIRVPWRQARLLVYLLIVAALFLMRGGIQRSNLFSVSSTGAGDTLVVTGGDLAPPLIDSLIEYYRREYPDLGVVVGGGGTNQALEDLINREAHAGFLVRPPGPEEQQLSLAVNGDSVLCFPVAWGGIALLAKGTSATHPITLGDLRRLLDGENHPRFHRIYVPDPNRGLWEVFTDSLVISDGSTKSKDRVVFVRDEAAVMAAVQADPGALGMASTLVLPGTLPDEIVLLSIEDASGGAVFPTYETLARGEYPLVHALYASCRDRDDIRGDKFVTFLTSKLGQRRVERAGFVPARLYLREVVLTTHPVGK